MYKDIHNVLKNIQDHFYKVFGEKFEMSPDEQYVDFSSKNYNLRVRAVFINKRIEDDSKISIQNRIDEVLQETEVQKGSMYEFTIKFVDAPLRNKYCINLIS